MWETISTHLHTSCHSTHLGSESTEESKSELAEGEGKVLVEEVAKENGHAMVRPAAMNQQQALQVPVMVVGCDKRLSSPPPPLSLPT